MNNSSFGTPPTEFHNITPWMIFFKLRGMSSGIEPHLHGGQGAGPGQPSSLKRAQCTRVAPQCFNNGNDNHPVDKRLCCHAQKTPTLNAGRGVPLIATKAAAPKGSPSKNRKCRGTPGRISKGSSKAGRVPAVMSKQICALDAWQGGSEGLENNSRAAGGESCSKGSTPRT